MFQIKFKHGQTGFSYDYFTATEAYEKRAAECATKLLEQQREVEKYNVFFLFKGHAKAPKSLTVSEYNKITKKMVKGGMKFKLKLGFLEMSLKGGAKSRKEWYEPIM